MFNSSILELGLKGRSNTIQAMFDNKLIVCIVKFDQFCIYLMGWKFWENIICGVMKFWSGAWHAWVFWCEGRGLVGIVVVVVCTRSLNYLLNQISNLGFYESRFGTIFYVKKGFPAPFPPSPTYYGNKCS